MSTAARRQGPLTGVRIVELAGIGPAPFAGMLLSDLGADVVQIVRPGTPIPAPLDFVNRNRRVLSLDLKKPEDVAQILALVEHADLFIEGFRPGTTERVGLGPDALLAKNPRLVYGRMTGWGQTGPLAKVAGHDINYLSITGALGAIGPADRPVPPLNLVADYGGGALYLVMGLLAGLLHARSTGQGQVVDCAMSDNVTSMLAMFHSFSQMGLWKQAREANFLDGGAPFYRTYVCKDGLHLAVGPLEPQFYAQLVKGLGVDDPRLANPYDVSCWPLMRETFEARFFAQTRDEWMAIFDGTDACVSAVITMKEAESHPQLVARKAFSTVDGITQPSAVPGFSETPGAIAGPATRAEAADVLAGWKR